METPIERKKKTIINIIYYAIILGIFYFFMKYAFGIFLPFIIAFIVAAVLQKPINAICRKTPLKRGIVSTVLVLLLLSVLVTLLVFMGAELVSIVKSFGTFISNWVKSLPNTISTIQVWLYKKIEVLPDSLENIAKPVLDSLFNRLTTSAAEESSAIATTVTSAPVSFDWSALSTPITGVLSFAKNIPSTLIAVVISIIASCFMASDFDYLKNFVKRQFPAEKKHALTATKSILRNSILKLVKAYIIIIFITFCEMTIGLKILDFCHIYNGGYVLFIAAGTAIVDIMPVLGTGTVIVPWAIYSFISGDAPMGVGLLIIYAVITVARQFIEPKLVAGQLGLPPFVTIMGMFIGLKLFGVIGMMIVPLMIILLKLLNDDGIIHIWVPEEKTAEEFAEEKASKKTFADKFLSLFKKKEKKSEDETK